MSIVLEVKKMHPELKTKWLAALRSGDYAQGKHVLRTTSDQYCCIGVLCNVLDPNAWKEPTDLQIDINAYRYADGWTRLPSERTALEDFGWNASEPVVPINPDIDARLTQAKRDNQIFVSDDLQTRYITLVALNDNGFTFTEIADLIEQHL